MNASTTNHYEAIMASILQSHLQVAFYEYLLGHGLPTAVANICAMFVVRSFTVHGLCQRLCVLWKTVLALMVGYGARICNGERVVEYAGSFKLTVVSASRKHYRHPNWFFCRNTKTQIDFLLMKETLRPKSCYRRRHIAIRPRSIGR